MSLKCFTCKQTLACLLEGGGGEGLEERVEGSRYVELGEEILNA